MIASLDARDIRFPTSRHSHGSDAMNRDPDYSCAYVTLLSEDGDALGNGLTFTIGRGNDLCVAAPSSSVTHSMISKQIPASPHGWSWATASIAGSDRKRASCTLQPPP